ncbi:MAG: CerR family C-terminal domain-containing protein, partial [Candidatus Deferrimicrobiaceae bacterium]
PEDARATPREKPLPERTRERLLNAAGEVFAERGFRRATVREICRRAHVNIASVNYYFKGKEDLYADVLEFAYRQARQKYPESDPSAQAGTPQRRLSRFVRILLLRILDEGRPAWFGKLMAREFVEPTGALDRVIERAILPLHQSLGTLVREIVGDRPGDAEIRRHVFSILGQCLFYRHARPVITKLYPDVRFDAAEIERTARHIATVALSATKPPVDGK